jgi:hypothetical protein
LGEVFEIGEEHLAEVAGVDVRVNVACELGRECAFAAGPEEAERRADRGDDAPGKGFAVVLDG